MYFLSEHDIKEHNNITEDTIMSYNQGPDGWDYEFSDVDIATLIKIWGVEKEN